MSKLAAWDSNPLKCFADFIAGPDFALTSSRQRDLAPKPLSPESAAIYRFMFGKFAAWMLEERLKMSTVTGRDLQRFVALAHDGQRDLNSKIAYRYLRLLERCYDYLERAPNPARDAIVGIDRAQIARDAPMTALNADELQRFMAALPGQRADDDNKASGWKRRRDRAMQVTMALAGLRVAEAIGLLVDEVGRQPDIEGALVLNITPEQKHRTSYEHTTTLPKEGVAELTAWLSERAELNIPGALVFPANLEGEPLHKATVYRQVKATFGRAGLAVSRAGGRTLRNTFASQQLRQGTPQSELTTVLGLALERSAEAYKYAKVNEETSAPEAGPTAKDA
ncbi:tyrosine-type recombinase/integrase [Massilia norwichensis]|uniref:Site-specific integrase n=1 Tax=Massilia norwichensis TaxID=1442366 RepID=A0ABT2AB74_9BURK|nr:site-specific integrase [Massilia norwichensis]MCS0591407.1 site-specific integrase [Massilia norwichensis]